MTTTAITKIEFYKREYKKLCDADEPRNPEHYAVAKENPLFNRYSNVLPNEPTRVRFSKRGRYFNANWMLGRRAIASQAPTEMDLENFFYMIRKRNVEVIVCLTNPIEKKREKSFDYFSEYKGTVVFENGKERIVERKIPIEGKGEITHFHLENWPDCGVVSPKTLAALVLKVADAAKGKVFLAHCSAGVGRTGTFLGALGAHEEDSRNVYKIAQALRHPETGRVYSIQGPEQYGLIYETLEILDLLSE